ncbi:MAG: type IV toxin-antitoxin system AbiEi family antitoxin domain-containing protein [Micropruina sp.]|nr:MAG: type IV toxin-antitoxin system AbiEi family antitoxin domain-containing protein [Micropruina sp.]
MGPGPDHPANQNPGVYPTAALRRGGVDTRQLRRLLAAGTLVRVRRGWYATPHAHAGAVRAVACGGCLSSVSALRWYGVWVPETPGLHVRAERHRPVKLTPDLVRCDAGHHLPAPRAAVEPLPTALAVAWNCLDHEGRVVVLDSILNLGLLTPAQIMEALAGHRGLNSVLTACDRSESGTETLVRLRLRRRKVRVRPQVFVPGVGRVDLLVGRRLVLECDSRQHHSDPGAYQRDRDRDRALQAMGYLVIRLTYADVVHRWADVVPEILALIGRRAHLRPPRPGSIALAG